MTLHDVACRSLFGVACRDVLRHERQAEGDMFTRRQAIRWAELWLACWNDRDYDTLLAMHKGNVRFGGWNSAGADGTVLDETEAMKRHWAAIPFGLHSVPAELDEVAWDPESREITIVYV